MRLSIAYAANRDAVSARTKPSATSRVPAAGRDHATGSGRRLAGVAVVPAKAQQAQCSHDDEDWDRDVDRHGQEHQDDLRKPDTRHLATPQARRDDGSLTRLDRHVNGQSRDLMKDRTKLSLGRRRTRYQTSL